MLAGILDNDHIAIADTGRREECTNLRCEVCLRDRANAVRLGANVKIVLRKNEVHHPPRAAEPVDRVTWMDQVCMVGERIPAATNAVTNDPEPLRSLIERSREGRRCTVGKQ